jgi:hypothetical protein
LILDYFWKFPCKSELFWVNGSEEDFSTCTIFTVCKNGFLIVSHPSLGIMISVNLILDYGGKLPYKFKLFFLLASGEDDF